MINVNDFYFANVNFTEATGLSEDATLAIKEAYRNRAQRPESPFPSWHVVLYASICDGSWPLPKLYDGLIGLNTGEPDFSKMAVLGENHVPRGFDRRGDSDPLTNVVSYLPAGIKEQFGVVQLHAQDVQLVRQRGYTTRLSRAFDSKAEAETLLNQVRELGLLSSIESRASRCCNLSAGGFLLLHPETQSLFQRPAWVSPQEQRFDPATAPECTGKKRAAAQKVVASAFEELETRGFAVRRFGYHAAGLWAGILLTRQGVEIVEETVSNYRISCTPEKLDEHEIMQAQNELVQRYA